ncbi:5'/3'-nucleotidase SurE [Lutibaculum baratangense]|uniref:5'-nucleotidase SurE n=1 Tax=Lutibaculum baratangense AMV1 TaxID=631454 RepID=V4RDU6_9HYPH|nr:5'/3'-nucleotidase SurE [Lutibaculum baratangense]ESR23549.1 5-nucleotidase SurE [Lutibaculum baratangense AMV1]
MRILVTNDDGIHAPGLKTCEKIARALSDDVWIVAPETDQSGSSHSLTINDPLRLREVSERHFAVKGTPTDCVIMAVKHIMPEPPDLVLSGVNRGHNVAEDVTYSGTIAGAFEGSTLGIRSIALSQASMGGETRRIPWETAERHGPAVVRRLLEIGLDTTVILNVNFPAREPDDVTGFQVTTQGRRDQAMLGVDARVDGRGNPYYWLAFERRKLSPGQGTDLRAVEEGAISVTPLSLNLTDSPAHSILLDRMSRTEAG